jgi:molybdopterin-synthase adenylyltransferase
MPLTDLQIDRYSRQIIVGGIGGRGQERLLASKLMIVGELKEIETPLAYLVGAGVGEIRVVTPNEATDSIVARMRDLNPDVTVRIGDDDSRDATLVLAVIGSAESVAIAVRSFKRHPRTAAIVARLDDSPRVAVLPSPPPCPRCADAGLLGAFGPRVSTADFVAMIATTEALKLVAGFVEEVNARLIDFERYESRTQQLKSSSRCDCGASASSGKPDGR